MGKQSNKANKKAENFGKGNVTPTQVAFLVDRYLSDNNFSETRSLFRTEASSLLSKSSSQEAPKSLLSLGAILNDYICLKEQKVMVDQEKMRLEQEKSRVQTLLQSFQNAMNAYNASGSPPAPPVPTVAMNPAVTLPQSQPFTGSPAGLPAYKGPIVHSVSTPSNINTQLTNFSSPMTSYPLAINKRKDSKVVSDAPPVAKRSRNKSSTRTFADKAHIQESAQPSFPSDSSPNNSVGGSLQNGSSVAKCLFNQPSMPISANTSVPATPPRANSSQSDKSISPLEFFSTTNYSNDNTPEGLTTTRCTVISSKRVTVSPFKQIAYSMERNHCVSTSSPVKTNLKRQAKRDHVKGRLDFDGSDVNSDQPMADQISTSESEKELDLFDIDLSNLDSISFSDMLRDFDFECEEVGYSCHPAIDASKDTAAGSSPESMDGDMGANQLMSEFSSTVTEVLAQKDTSVQGGENGPF
ncbi:hypothetical protein L484_023633 [Morus notabilis]|uniref:LisH domain-containing protein n=1 Tax=Morus notabilis TaxID=981085 RepID=W9RGU5_9ROSA|nr:hypothetical protein L484_023633 [Morus notabilis]